MCTWMRRCKRIRVLMYICINRVATIGVLHVCMCVYPAPVNPRTLTNPDDPRPRHAFRLLIDPWGPEQCPILLTCSDRSRCLCCCPSVALVHQRPRALPRGQPTAPVSRRLVCPGLGDEPRRSAPAPWTPASPGQTRCSAHPPRRRCPARCSTDICTHTLVPCAMTCPPPSVGQGPPLVKCQPPSATTAVPQVLPQKGGAVSAAPAQCTCVATRRRSASGAQDVRWAVHFACCPGPREGGGWRCTFGPTSPLHLHLLVLPLAFAPVTPQTSQVSACPSAKGKVGRIRGKSGRVRYVKHPHPHREHPHRVPCRPLLSGWLILYRGWGVRGQKKVCVPKIDLQVRAPLINFIFS